MTIILNTVSIFYLYLGDMKIFIILFVFGIGFCVNEFITLEDLKWKKRIILIFPSLNDSFEIAFSGNLMQEMEARDMVYFVFADSIYSNTGYVFSGEYIQELKARYILGAKSSCWVLLGKDGGLKLRREEKMDWNEAFTVIDAVRDTKSEDLV